MPVALDIDTNFLQEGSRVKLSYCSPRHWWTVQVVGDRYAICIRQVPFKPKGTYWYTILDFEKKVRGATNYIGNGWDMETRGPYIGSRLLHVELLSGDVEISHRASTFLEILALDNSPSTIRKFSRARSS